MIEPFSSRSKRFSFKDHVFQIIPLVKPKNARNLCPASLSSLFKRFPLLSDHCNVVEADKEWRSHVNMPIDYFEIDSSQSTFAFYNMMDVEFYWNRVFAGFAAKLPNGEPQFPTLKAAEKIEEELLEASIEYLNLSESNLLESQQLEGILSDIRGVQNDLHQIQLDISELKTNPKTSAGSKSLRSTKLEADLDKLLGMYNFYRFVTQLLLVASEEDLNDPKISDFFIKCGEALD
ncbi:hypothetical protein DAPPUDRAFT_323665 [Daphnia pulex]|uniref:Uncharacterized protein n=1 Tax=Daphnia pulex TaxID=6669 RepID=E9GZE8_DAPPU|nr:hypothetical protein DAPPUDRAFT_323665 [Daphnia pulex]|eukprot:EFX75136.1 hypothetical protein DAPPUDRAFT_323665 [Daphnia pulex]